LFWHSAATRDARYLIESELKLKYGWSGGSQMAQVYVHRSGADLDNKLLAVYAGRPIETIKLKFAPIICALWCRKHARSEVLRTLWRAVKCAGVS